MTSKHERETAAEFAERYARVSGAIVDILEKKVIGDVWGANGFTTRAQADLLAERLGLGAGHRLLDIGTGRGWPGLYLAKKSGCDVVLTDLPIEGLITARGRAQKEHLDLVGTVVASGRHLPFGSESFDAIVHTDVVC